MYVMFWLLLSAAMAAFSPAADAGEPIGDIPRCYAGIWSGSAFQQDGERYPIIVVLSADGGRSVEYPTLGCSGKLELMDRLPKGYLFRERLDKGRSHCIDGGRVKLHLLGRGQLHYRWEDTRHESGAAGILNRSPSIEARGVPNRREALASADFDADEPGP